MNYEKKYNEALERAKKLHEEDCDTCQSCLEQLFPELKESKDEKIRKELIEHIKANCESDFILFQKFSPDDVLVWLENQGDEQKPVFEMKTPEESLGVDTDTYNKIVDECIFGEQKPFNYENATIQQTDFAPKSAMEAIKEEKVDNANKVEQKSAEYNEDNELSCFESALFTAFSDAWQSYLLGEKVNVKQWAKEHSKELLEAAKEELKKIEQKPTENEELTEFDKAVGVSIGTWNPKTPEQIKSVKAVSKKLLELAKKQINDEQKPAWSEDNEEILNLIIARLHSHPNVEAEEYDKDYHWLTSLKDRYTWKPSDEQIEALANALSLAKNCGEESAFDLRTLHEQLKKLKGE